MAPRNFFISMTFIGVGIVIIDGILQGSTYYPSPHIMCLWITLKLTQKITFFKIEVNAIYSTILLTLLQLIHMIPFISKHIKIVKKRLHKAI